MSKAAIIPLAIALVACRPEPGAGPLEAGIATVALDSPVGVAMGGYGRTPREGEPGSPFTANLPSSRGVHSLPTARALALSNGLEEVLLVRVDLCLVTASLRARAEAHLREAGIQAKLLLSATHTHAAPARFFQPAYVQGSSGIDVPARAMDSYDPEVEDRLAQSIAQAAAEALSRRRPASVGAASLEAGGLNADRRCQNDDLYGPGYKDSRLTVVRLDEVDAQGSPVRPMAGLIHFSMHGTGLGGANSLISSDAPGAVELAASDRLGVPMLFLQGTAGDVAPAESPLGHSGLQAIERLGAQAAPLVEDAFARAGPGSAKPSARLSVAERGVPVTRAAVGYARGEYGEFGAIGCMLGILECKQYTPPKEAICLPLARNGFTHTSVASLRLEEVLIVTLPGEPTTAIGERVRELAAKTDPDAVVLVAGYAQDHFGYILEEEDFLRGGYEPTVSPWGWKFGPFILGQVKELLSNPAEQPAFEPPVLPEAGRRPIGESAVPPSVTAQPSDTNRLATAVFRFHGGDSNLGLPAVSLEREEGGAFVPVMASPTRPLAGGPEIVLRYEASPTFAADPAATSRAHLWTAEWETLPETPDGRYRLVAEGKAVVAGEEREYRLKSASFAVARSSEVGASASAELSTGLLLVRLRFPPHQARYASGGDPIGNYRMRDPDSRPADGALVRGGRARATASFSDGSSETVELAWDEAAGALVGRVASAAPLSRVSIAAGESTDAHGNRNGNEIRAEVRL